MNGMINVISLGIFIFLIVKFDKKRYFIRIYKNIFVTLFQIAKIGAIQEFKNWFRPDHKKQYSTFREDMALFSKLFKHNFKQDGKHNKTQALQSKVAYLKQRAKKTGRPEDIEKLKQTEDLLKKKM